MASAFCLTLESLLLFKGPAHFPTLKAAAPICTARSLEAYKAARPASKVLTLDRCALSNDDAI